MLFAAVSFMWKILKDHRGWCSQAVWMSFTVVYLPIHDHSSRQEFTESSIFQWFWQYVCAFESVYMPLCLCPSPVFPLPVWRIWVLVFLQGFFVLYEYLCVCNCFWMKALRKWGQSTAEWTTGEEQHESSKLHTHTHIHTFSLSPLRSSVIIMFL